MLWSKLVGGLEHEFYDFPHFYIQLGTTIPADELHHFSEGWAQPPSSKILWHLETPQDGDPQFFIADFQVLDIHVLKRFLSGMLQLKTRLYMLQFIKGYTMLYLGKL